MERQSSRSEGPLVKWYKQAELCFLYLVIRKVLDKENQMFLLGPSPDIPLL